MSMKIVRLPVPPNPDDRQYLNNPQGWARAAFGWMNDVKGKIEAQSLQNDTPLNQNFAVSSYTTNTSLSGTSTGTDVSNFVCSIVAAMQKKGIVKPV